MHVYDPTMHVYDPPMHVYDPTMHVYDPTMPVTLLILYYPYNLHIIRPLVAAAISTTLVRSSLLGLQREH